MSDGAGARVAGRRAASDGDDEAGGAERDGGDRAPRGAGGDGEHGGLHEHDGPLGGGQQLVEPAVEGEEALGRGEAAAEQHGQARARGRSRS